MSIHLRGEIPSDALAGVVPILLSYHGNSHYNSLQRLGVSYPLGLRKTRVIQSHRSRARGESSLLHADAVSWWLVSVWQCYPLRLVCTALVRRGSVVSALRLVAPCRCAVLMCAAFRDVPIQCSFFLIPSLRAVFVVLRLRRCRGAPS